MKTDRPVATGEAPAASPEKDWRLAEGAAPRRPDDDLSPEEAIRLIRGHEPADSPEPVEHWRSHPQYTHMEVSTAGRVRRNGRPARLAVNDRGYLWATCEGRPRGVGVLVLETFVGPRPDGHDCDHVNDNRRDNRLGNLRWLVIGENRSQRGVKNSAAKLTPEDVLEIRRLGPTHSQVELAGRFGVHPTNIALIVQGKTWKHIGGVT